MDARPTTAEEEAAAEAFLNPRPSTAEEAAAFLNSGHGMADMGLEGCATRQQLQLQPKRPTTAEEEAAAEAFLNPRPDSAEAAEEFLHSGNGAAGDGMATGLEGSATRHARPQLTVRQLEKSISQASRSSKSLNSKGEAAPSASAAAARALSPRCAAAAVGRANKAGQVRTMLRLLLLLLLLVLTTRWGRRGRSRRPKRGLSRRTTAECHL